MSHNFYIYPARGYFKNLSKKDHFFLLDSPFLRHLDNKIVVSEKVFHGQLLLFSERNFFFMGGCPE